MYNEKQHFVFVHSEIGLYGILDVFLDISCVYLYTPESMWIVLVEAETEKYFVCEL